MRPAPISGADDAAPTGAGTWLTRRLPHPGVPRLDALVPDAPSFTSDALFQRMVSSPAGPTPPERFATSAGLWEDALRRGLRSPAFRLVRSGTTLPLPTTCRRAGIGQRSLDDVIQPNRVLELHDAGATMVLQGLQFTDPHLARVANNLALDLGHPVQINAYLSPVAATGLELHFDFHDVFVVQLDGRKRWRVWEPLGRTRHPVRLGPPVAMPTFAELGPPALDLTLDAGDCLYLPRGFPHAAETVESASSHLTIGVRALMWHQAVRHALDEAVGGGALRESLTPDVGGAPVLDLLAPHLDDLAIRRWMAREVWRRQPATRLRPRQPPTVELDTPVTLTPGPLLWLLLAGQRVELGLGDRALTMPAAAGAVLTDILGRDGCFTLAALAGDLDDASRLVIGQRLAVEGVIAVG